MSWMRTDHGNRVGCDAFLGAREGVGGQPLDRPFRQAVSTSSGPRACRGTQGPEPVEGLGALSLSNELVCARFVGRVRARTRRAPTRESRVNVGAQLACARFVGRVRARARRAPTRESRVNVGAQLACARFVGRVRARTRRAPTRESRVNVGAPLACDRFVGRVRARTRRAPTRDRSGESFGR